MENHTIYKETDKVDHRVLHALYKMLAPKLRGSREQKKSFYRLRHNINKHVNHCADNVKLTLYINDVDIVICAGKKDNEIVITIEEDGNTLISYTEETWSKYFKDCWKEMKEFPMTFISVLKTALIDNPFKFVDSVMSLVSSIKKNPKPVVLP